MKRTSFSPLRAGLSPTRLRPRRTSRSLSPAVSTMNPKTRQTLAAVGALWVALATSTARASTSPITEAAPALTPAQQNSPAIVRGRYLVERVGLCADCHSPRNEKGEFLPALWLKGAALPFQPTVPMPWSPAAPPIAGLPSMTDAQALDFLQTGKRPDGSVPRPPMPEFRFNREDAAAVVAYLRSLP